VVVDSAAGSQAGVDAAAAKAGALVEFLVAPATALPLDPGGFDVVIVLAASLPELGAPSGVFDEAARVTRPAGRVLFIEHLRKPGVRALRSKPAAPPLAAVCRLLESAGLRSARVLAEAAGMRFYEAVKPRR
jgi:ubiquinone/menaquinone biosynthesis C-methylase UbiE